MKNKLLVGALLVGSLSAVSLANATMPVTAAAISPIKATAIGAPGAFVARLAVVLKQYTDRAAEGFVGGFVDHAGGDPWPYPPYPYEDSNSEAANAFWAAIGGNEAGG